MSKAVFLDRDGTVSEEMGYIHEKDLPNYRLVPGAAEGMKKLAAAGYRLCLTTNQSGVARGYYGEDTVHKVHARLAELLQAQGAKLDAVYYCPHHPDPGEIPMGGEGVAGRMDSAPVAELAYDCDCRKPKAGMAKKGEKDFGLDLEKCWTVGDKDADVNFAKSFGGRTVLVRTGYGKETYEMLKARGEAPQWVADDLSAAADLILKEDGKA